MMHLEFEDFTSHRSRVMLLFSSQDNKYISTFRTITQGIFMPCKDYQSKLSFNFDVFHVVQS